MERTSIDRKNGKKLVLLLACLIFVYADLVIERKYDSKYQREVCGDNYECSASRDFIPNVDILEAFKMDLRKEIELPEYEIRGLIYRKIIALTLPSDGESFKRVIFIKGSSGDNLKVEVELKKSRNELVVTYIFEVEESIKTYIKTLNGVEIFNKTSML